MPDEIMIDRHEGQWRARGMFPNYEWPQMIAIAPTLDNLLKKLWKMWR